MAGHALHVEWKGDGSGGFGKKAWAAQVKFPMTLDMKEYCTEEYQTRISAWREKVPASRPEATAAPACALPQSRPPCGAVGADVRGGGTCAREPCMCARAPCMRVRTCVCARAAAREGGFEGGGGGAFAEGASERQCEGWCDWRQQAESVCVRARRA